MIQNKFPTQKRYFGKCQLRYDEFEWKIAMMPDYLNKYCIPMYCILIQYNGE